MAQAGIKHIRTMTAGQRFNRLTAIEFAGYCKDGNRQSTLWKFRCDCGNETITRATLVRNGKTKSCGCLRAEATKRMGLANSRNRQSDTRIYRIWGAMKARCYKPTNCNFKYYGGRGISVCAEWEHSLESFRTWAMANGYADNLTIDRYPDLSGNYEPSNCRWITIEDQQRNRRPPRKRKGSGLPPSVAGGRLDTPPVSGSAE